MARDDGDSVRLDIDRLVFSIQDTVSHDLLMPPKCCIFKTPVILYRHNNKAYIPDAFSIGPLHHGKRKLKATEKIKADYLQGLISRSPDTMLRTMVSSIMEVEKEARECYAEAIAYNPEQLVKILVIDGCFLIEFFRKSSYHGLEIEDGLGIEDDPIFSRSCMLQFLYHDLILLENQVPWMVLEILFDLTKDSSDEKPLVLLAMDFFQGLYFSNGIPPRDQVINIKGIKHFVDLLRKMSTLSSTNRRPDLSVNREGTNHFANLFRKLSTLSSTKENQLRRRAWELLPSATRLVEAGIKFTRSTSQTNLDVKFNDGVLEIPPLQIDDITETVFRNLISYEQCHTIFDDRITSYAILLDSLINTAKDIDILCESDIIDNWLNPEDAAQLFNKLYHDTCVYYHYTDVSREVNKFYRRHWPKWRAGLVRNYFNTPWAVLSTLAAIILLIMTLLQTLYTMKK